MCEWFIKRCCPDHLLCYHQEHHYTGCSYSHPAGQQIEHERFSPKEKKEKNLTAANQSGHFSPCGKSLASPLDEFQDSEETLLLLPLLLVLPLLLQRFSKKLSPRTGFAIVSAAWGVKIQDLQVWFIWWPTVMLRSRNRSESRGGREKKQRGCWWK